MCWRCVVEGIRVTEDGKVFDVATGQLLSDHRAHAGQAVVRRTDNGKRKARRKAERKARRR